MMAGSDAAGGQGGSGGDPRHIPVLLSEVIEALGPRDGELYIDGTFGAGGYSRALLDAAQCRVLALDRDPSAVAAAAALVARYAGRLTVVEAPFAMLEAVAREVPAESASGAKASEASQPDGVVLDIGVSSMQIDDPARGFSFMADGPLDMRMGAGGLSAADIVNTHEEAGLADILFHLGEEKRSRAIARAICRARDEAAITTTRALAQVVEKAIGRRPGDDKHPATRTFQALRIYVNDELGQLGAALIAAERILKPGGRLVVVTFHSLEDRIVKRFLQRRAGRLPAQSRHAPAVRTAPPPPSFRIVNQHPLTPSERELSANPRARSAKLRAAVRTEAPALAPEDMAELGIPTLREGRRR